MVAGSLCFTELQAGAVRCVAKTPSASKQQLAGQRLLSGLLLLARMAPTATGRSGGFRALSGLPTWGLVLAGSHEIGLTDA